MPGPENAQFPKTGLFRDYMVPYGPYIASIGSIIAGILGVSLSLFFATGIALIIVGVIFTTLTFMSRNIDKSVQTEPPQKANYPI